MSWYDAYKKQWTRLENRNHLITKVNQYPYEIEGRVEVERSNYHHYPLQWYSTLRSDSEFSPDRRTLVPTVAKMYNNILHAQVMSPHPKPSQLFSSTYYADCKTNPKSYFAELKRKSDQTTFHDDRLRQIGTLEVTGQNQFQRELLSAWNIPQEQWYIATNYNTFAEDGSKAKDYEEEVIEINE